MWFIHLKLQLLKAFCKRWIISKIYIAKFGFSLRSKIFDLKHSTVLRMFQKKLCYGYNHLGVIPFEYIAGVTRDGKFAGSMINQSTQIVLMDEWTNDSLCCEDAKRILQGYYLFILLLFSVTILPYSVLFAVERNLCKDIYNS